MRVSSFAHRRSGVASDGNAHRLPGRNDPAAVRCPAGFVRLLHADHLVLRLYDRSFPFRSPGGNDADAPPLCTDCSERERRTDQPFCGVGHHLAGQPLQLRKHQPAAVFFSYGGHDPSGTANHRRAGAFIESCRRESASAGACGGRSVAGRAGLFDTVFGLAFRNSGGLVASDQPVWALGGFPLFLQRLAVMSAESGVDAAGQTADLCYRVAGTISHVPCTADLQTPLASGRYAESADDAMAAALLRTGAGCVEKPFAEERSGSAPDCARAPDTGRSSVRGEAGIPKR